jgi:hypothetical protein
LGSPGSHGTSGPGPGRTKVSLSFPSVPCGLAGAAGGGSPLTIRAWFCPLPGPQRPPGGTGGPGWAVPSVCLTLSVCLKLTSADLKDRCTITLSPVPVRGHSRPSLSPSGQSWQWAGTSRFQVASPAQHPLLTSVPEPCWGEEAGQGVMGDQRSTQGTRVTDRRCWGPHTGVCGSSDGFRF